MIIYLVNLTSVFLQIKTYLVLFHVFQLKLFMPLTNMNTYACDMSKKSACRQHLEKKNLITRLVRPHNEKNTLLNCYLTRTCKLFSIKR